MARIFVTFGRCLPHWQYIFATHINVLPTWQNIPNYVDGTFQLRKEYSSYFG